MKLKTLKFIAANFLIAIALMFAATSNGAKTTPASNPQEAVEIESVTVSATIMGVNYSDRTVTFGTPNGALKTYRVSKEVVNFDQLRAYDQVKITVVEAIAVFLRKTDAPPSAGETITVSLAPKGASPGLITTDTKEVTAKLTAVNRKTRMATLLFVDGQRKGVKVNRAVDLAKVRPGDDVTVRVTEGLAILVEKP